jgi:hypothetical protein
MNIFHGKALSYLVMAWGFISLEIPKIAADYPTVKYLTMASVAIATISRAISYWQDANKLNNIKAVDALSSVPPVIPPRVL